MRLLSISSSFISGGDALGGNGVLNGGDSQLLFHQCFSCPWLSGSLTNFVMIVFSSLLFPQHIPGLTGYSVEMAAVLQQAQTQLPVQAALISQK
jgi:hypothetical protein